MKVNTKVRAGRPPSCGTVTYGTATDANGARRPQGRRVTRRPGRHCLISSSGSDSRARARKLTGETHEGKQQGSRRSSSGLRTGLRRAVSNHGGVGPRQAARRIDAQLFHALENIMKVNTKVRAGRTPKCGAVPPIYA